MNSGTSPTTKGSASSAHGQFLAVLMQPNGTGNALSDALSLVCNASKVGPTTLQQHTSESLSPVPPPTSSPTHNTQDPTTPTNNTGLISAPKSPNSLVLARIEPHSHTTPSHFNTSNTSLSPPHLYTSDPSSRPSPPTTTQILQDSKQLKRKITDEEVALFVKRLKKNTNESEVVYFDPQTTTLTHILGWSTSS